MIVRVDSNIAKAIDAYIADNEIECRDFAKHIGVSNASITKWRKVGNGITGEKWQKIFPLIKKYLPNDRIYLDGSGDEQYSSTTEHVSSYVFEPKYVPAMIPVFSLEQIKLFDNTLESIAQFGSKCSSKYVAYYPKHVGKTSVMALAIEDDCFAPMLPKNTTAFICTNEQPVENGLTIVKLASGDVIIGTYKTDNNNFCFINPVNGKVIMSDTMSNARKSICWAFPILYYQVVTF